MIEERTSRGREFSLRPRGIGRWFGAGFLAVWLTFWAVGEAFALWIVGSVVAALLTGQPPRSAPTSLQLGVVVAVGAFLLVWLALWTVGGIAAMRELLRTTVGRDRLIAGPAGLTVIRSLGLFARTREIPADELRRIYLISRRAVLMAETASGAIELSTLGTPEERAEVATLLRDELRLVEPGKDEPAEDRLPDGWQEVIDPEGGIVLVPDLGVRRKQAMVATGIALAATAVASFLIAKTLENFSLIGLAVMAVTAATGLWWGAFRLSLSRPEWRIGSGSLTLRRRSGSQVTDVFQAAALELTVRSDDDGDCWFELVALAPGAYEAVPAGRSKTRRSIARAVHDPTVPKRLGRWLQRRASVRFEDRSTDDARFAELARLEQQLEQLGPKARAVVAWIKRHSS